MLYDKTTMLEQRLAANNKGSIRYLVRIFKETFNLIKGHCIILIFLIMLNSILLPSSAYLWGRYVDKLNNSISIDILGNAVLILLSYFLINFMLKYLNRYLFGNNDIERLDIVQSHRYQEKINRRIFSKLNKITTEYLEIPAINDKIDRVTSFVNDKWSGLNPKVVKNAYIILGQTVAIVLNGTILYHIHPLLCIIILITPIPVFYISSFSNKLKFKFKVDNSQLKRKADYFQDILKETAAKEVRALNLSDFFFEKWKKNIDEYTIKETKALIIATSLETLSSVLSDIVIAFINVYAILLMIKNKISIGQFSTVLIISGILINGIGSLISSFSEFISKRNESAEYYDVMDLEEENSCKKSLDGISLIELQNVSYRYPMTNRYALKNISLTIKKGEKIALVGINGAGKTTFAKILLKILSPSQGVYYINGIESEKVSANTFYDNVSVVFQNPARFNTFTIQDNIYMGDTSKPVDILKAEAALSFAALTDIPSSTYLGKDLGGTDLSGGQWQKLSIGKAYYRGRDFIVLDEPTSNIDPLIETEIYKKYLSLSQDKTVIYVTHRISTSTLADRIIVFDGGEIVEEGTFDQLMANKGSYYELFNTQSKWYQR